MSQANNQPQHIRCYPIFRKHFPTFLSYLLYQNFRLRQLRHFEVCMCGYNSFLLHCYPFSIKIHSYRILAYRGLSLSIQPLPMRREQVLRERQDTYLFLLLLLHVPLLYHCHRTLNAKSYRLKHQEHGQSACPMSLYNSMYILLL